MVKYIKYIAIVLGLVLITVIVFSFLGETSPEQQIENQIKKFLSMASKSSGDRLSTGLLKSKRLESLFTPHCKFYVGVSSFSGTYTPMQISANAMRCRSMFKYVKFSAHDLEINLSSPSTATVDFTGSLSALTKRGKSIEDYKDLVCELRLIEGEWLIYSVSIREIMKK